MIYSGNGCPQAQEVIVTIRCLCVEGLVKLTTSVVFRMLHRFYKSLMVCRTQILEYFSAYLPLTTEHYLYDWRGKIL